VFEAADAFVGAFTRESVLGIVDETAVAKAQ
jgi:hypothetical protein